MANPTDEGLRNSLQTAADLHVLPGFPDIVSESQGERPADAKGSINELATTAAYSGYSAIILDTPSAGVWCRVLFPLPIPGDGFTANRCGCMDLGRAFRTVTQKIAGQHRITPGNIFVVLNQRENGMLTTDQFHAARRRGLPQAQSQCGFSTRNGNHPVFFSSACCPG